MPASLREVSTITSPLAPGLQYATGVRYEYAPCVIRDNLAPSKIQKSYYLFSLGSQVKLFWQFSHKLPRLLPEGWYRFSSPAGSLLPTECPGHHHQHHHQYHCNAIITLSWLFWAGGNYCGTNIPVWMKGESDLKRYFSLRRVFLQTHHLLKTIPIYVQILSMFSVCILSKVSTSPKWNHLHFFKIHLSDSKWNMLLSDLNHQKQQEPWQLEFKVEVWEAFFWLERSHVADSMALRGPSPSQLTSLLLGLSGAKTDLIVFPEKVGG